MVARAIAYYDEMGPRRRWRGSTPTRLRSSWTAISTSSLADPKEPSSPTASTSRCWEFALASFVDADGKEFGEEIGLMASAEGAWVDYKWKNPVSGEIEQKSSWIVAHDGHIFGAGVYRP